MSATRYQVTHEEILYDTIEGQVIVLNLLTGTYYQLKDNAVSIWNGVVNGCTLSELAAPFAAHAPAHREAIEQAIAQFTADLEAEAIIVPRGADAPPGAVFTLENASDANENFVAPALLKYTDMQALLLLDPVHDVDAQGWPLANPNESL